MIRTEAITASGPCHNRKTYVPRSPYRSGLPRFSVHLLLKPRYAEAYRNGERISTAHVECTVNQLINWRMCKKQQMGWSRAGAQDLLHVKTAIINGRLDRYSGHHSVPADIAA